MLYLKRKRSKSREKIIKREDVSIKNILISLLFLFIFIVCSQSVLAGNNIFYFQKKNKDFFLISLLEELARINN